MNFSIKSFPNNALLVLSSLGFYQKKKLQVACTRNCLLKVFLAEDAAAIGRVVVTGWVLQGKRSPLVDATATISAEAFDETATP